WEELRDRRRPPQRHASRQLSGASDVVTMRQ
ncbi:MAG: hypothetical protein ACI9AQ_002778, partial [Dinoroseobacter sp.]